MIELRDAIDQAFEGEPAMPQIVDQIIADAHHARSRRRRSTGGIAVLGVAVAATLIVVLPSLLAGSASSISPAAQAAISTLAVTASHGPKAPAPPGHYLHIVDRIKEGTETDVIQTWIAHNGLAWMFYSPNQNVSPQVTWGDNDTSGPSLRYLDSLPTTGNGLEKYLQTHVTGSNTKDEAIFVAVGDMLRSGDVPPSLRVAAFEVLEQTPHISVTHTRDSLRRRALKVTFTDPTGLSGPDSLLFDPKTAMLIGEQDGPAFTVTYTQNIVTSVPTAVRDQAGQPPPQPPAPPPLSQKPSPQPSWSS
jgi:hypothetical protein